MGSHFIDVSAEGVDIVPGLRLLPTPGPPGRVALELTSRGQAALITGDCVDIATRCHRGSREIIVRSHKCIGARVCT